MREFKSEAYNYIFNDDNGFFARWGKTPDEDPVMAPSAEILDIEVSTVCSGVPNANGVSTPCQFCYKSNTPVGKNMSLETFVNVFDKVNEAKVLTQIALGVGDVDANPDLFKIMDYCRSRGVVPNITINGTRLTQEIVDNLVNYCGAVSVSNYNTDICYDAVERLANAGLAQCNIHQLLAAETYEKCFKVINDIKSDARLKNINAVVFLALKPKGLRNTFTSVTQEQFSALVNYALEKQVPFGFDSCSAPLFEKAIENNPHKEQWMIACEPCESFGMFSAYINVDGKYFPCSFCEGVGEWSGGIDVTQCQNFVDDVWNNPLVDKYRKKMICNGRNCPMFKIVKE
jgi:MoaA/NifB/PqqE/SkfB family radical SAM enzyme